jgi:AcrR family transcriptional regulator
MARKRSDAPERILREAMTLFAKKGYERTTVPDIQAAAGLAPGSGAMYKHYPSKEAVLRAGVERYVLEARGAHRALRDITMPPRDALEWIGRTTMAIMATKHDELRILWRLQHVPRLHSKARREIVQASYRTISTWLRDRAKRGEIREHDSDAVAAVILGSITMFRVFEALWGERTIHVDDERFIRAWYDVVSRGLGLDAQASSKGARRKRRAR